MKLSEMTLEEKRVALFDWIRNLDEFALDDLIEEYLYLDTEEDDN